MTSNKTANRRSTRPVAASLILGLLCWSLPGSAQAQCIATTQASAGITLAGAATVVGATSVAGATTVATATTMAVGSTIAAGTVVVAGSGGNSEIVVEIGRAHVCNP